MENINQPDDSYKYISVVFYDKLTDKYCSPEYNYKTKKNLKKGQLLEVQTRFGTSKCAVYNDNVNPKDISYPLDKIVEI